MLHMALDLDADDALNKNTTPDAGQDAGENAGYLTGLRSPDLHRTQDAARDTTLDAERWRERWTLDCSTLEPRRWTLIAGYLQDKRPFAERMLDMLEAIARQTAKRNSIHLVWLTECMGQVVQIVHVNGTVFDGSLLCT